MFCHKCGNQLPENSGFCPKCGTKIVRADTAQQTSADSVTAPAPIEPATPKVSAAPVSRVVQDYSASMPTPVDRQSEPKKKNSKKFILGIAGGAIAAIIAIIIIAISRDGSNQGPSNLFQIASSVSPMTEFGFDATYGEMFNWLMGTKNRRTNFEQQGNVAYLTFLGTVTGGKYDVSVVLRISGLSPNAPNIRVEPHAMTVNGIEVPDFNNPEGVIMDLFWAQYRWANHQEKEVETFMSYVELDPFMWSPFGIIEEEVAPSFVIRPGTSGRTGANETSQVKHTGEEVLYRGIAVSSFLGLKINVVRDVFGTPSSEGDWWMGSPWIGYGGIAFLYDGAGNIVHIELNSSACEINGVTLDKNRRELIAILGNPNPMYEGWNGNEMSDGYYMSYEYKGFDMSFYFYTTPDDEANVISISPR